MSATVGVMRTSTCESTSWPSVSETSALKASASARSDATRSFAAGGYESLSHPRSRVTYEGGRAGITASPGATRGTSVGRVRAGPSGAPRFTVAPFAGPSRSSCAWARPAPSTSASVISAAKKILRKPAIVLVSMRDRSPR